MLKALFQTSLFKALIIFLVPPTLFLFGFTTQQSLYRTEYTWTSPTNNGLTHLSSPFVMDLEIDTTAHGPLLAPAEHAHLLTDLLTTHQAAQSSLSHLASRATHDLACTFRHHRQHHNRIRPSSSSSSSSMSDFASSTTQHTLTTIWSIHNLTKHTLTHLTDLSSHSGGYLPLEQLYHALLRRAMLQLEASHVSPEQRQRMSVLPKLYFDSERYRWSEYTRARAAVARVEAAVAALEREKGAVVAMEEVVARFADRLGGLGEFLLTSPRVVGVVRDGEDGRGRGGRGWSWPSSRWWSWSGEPAEEVGKEEEEEEAMREYLKWWFFDNVVVYTGTRWAVFEQEWHALGCGDVFM